MIKNITKKQLVEKLDASFVKVALEDIKRALDANTNLAVFILGTCFIDALAGFCYGKTKPNDSKDGHRFQNFVKKYKQQLHPYKPKTLWAMRCGLSHSYSTGKFMFVNKKPQYHNKRSTKGRQIINDEDFYDALVLAYSQFKEDILTNKRRFAYARKRYNAPGLELMKIVQQKS